MEKKKVSIIVATFNRDAIIGETIQSVLEQTYANWECIIVDDGSTDNTEQIVKKYTEKDSRIIFYHRPKDRPKGPNAARNFGIENSVGEYVLSLDSDDWILPEHLDLKIKVFENNPEIDGVLSKTIMVDNDKAIIEKENRTFLTPNLLEGLMQQIETCSENLAPVSVDCQYHLN
jgi:glycosyltransferase involved in cell wall biosynthesis